MINAIITEYKIVGRIQASCLGPFSTLFKYTEAIGKTDKNIIKSTKFILKSPSIYLSRLCR